MRAPILLSFLTVCLLCPTYAGQERLPLLGDHGRIGASRVMLDPSDPRRQQVGALTFLGGIALDSDDSAFGGFSSMIVQGDRFTLLSDSGNVLRFRMDATFGLSSGQFGNLADGPGGGWSKIDRDSESMTTDGRGNYWVGFETFNQIWRYSPDIVGPGRGVAPLAMRNWPENLGAESLVRLHDGRFLTIGEDAHPRHHKELRVALVFSGDPIARPDTGFAFSYRPPAGYDPSDATELPDGRIIVLNRGFKPPFTWSAVLTLIDPRAIRQGAVVPGREIARFAAPLTVDNYEALAVTRENGATILWMASDDNQSILERSLLLKFRLNL
jgi:hypothetical protein